MNIDIILYRVDSMTRCDSRAERTLVLRRAETLRAEKIGALSDPNRLFNVRAEKSQQLRCSSH